MTIKEQVANLIWFVYLLLLLTRKCCHFLQDVFNKEHYIASQGPMPTTLNDFWRLIWQYGIKVVVMACNEYEGIPGKVRTLTRILSVA